MRIPAFVEKGDRISFIAPSYGCNIEPYRSGFENALKKFQSLGYELQLGSNCYEGKGIGISNTPEKCGEEVNTFFTKQPGKVIFSCGGGELMCEILDYVDFQGIKEAEPKWYVGYSDNTNLTFLLATLCDTAAIYGPCAPAFGMEPWHPSLEDLLGILTGEKKQVAGYPLWERESMKDEEHPLEPYHVTEPRILKTYPEYDNISLEGRLLGGCMDCLGKLVGTNYDKVAAFAEKYQEDGIIWYMEACELNVMDIRRTLWQLEHAGWFRYVKGFLFGRPQCHGEELFGLDQYEAVMGILGKYQVPVLMDLDIGHIPPMMPIVNGAYARVDTRENDIIITYSLTDRERKEEGKNAKI